MRRRLRTLWTACAVVVPLVTAGIWFGMGHGLPAAIGLAVGVFNAALLIRRRIPLRIPAFTPPDQRKPVVIKTLRWPGHG